MSVGSVDQPPAAARPRLPLARLDRLERFATFYARVALGAAFLSAVAGRFGLWSGKSPSTAFANFTRYAAEVNSFMPARTIPFLAWAATAAELTLGVSLLAGIWPRRVALASAVLLALFGTAMAISFGIQSPLDYSVFSASAAALLLALQQPDDSGARRTARAAASRDRSEERP